MLDIVLISFFAALTVRGLRVSDRGLSEIPTKVTDRLGKLWDIAHQGMRDNRLVRAEKALLTILKIDDKNSAAYNRLGILYAKQKEYKDAIDCFEIASTIDPTPSSLHNLGLIYYETENYPKAATAFEQALKMDDQLAARHIAYAKVQEKLGNGKLMIDELEKAVELEPNRESYTLLMKGYESQGRQADADIIADKLKKPVKAAAKPKKVSRPKRVVI
jgi:tetratricopeptide (TPR) repeat protein